MSRKVTRNTCTVQPPMIGAIDSTRAILVWEGQIGREHDTLAEFSFTAPLKGDYGNPECLVPGEDGKSFSRRGMVVDRNTFEKMKDEFYSMRG